MSGNTTPKTLHKTTPLDNVKFVVKQAFEDIDTHISAALYKYESGDTKAGQVMLKRTLQFASMKQTQSALAINQAAQEYTNSMSRHLLASKCRINFLEKALKDRSNELHSKEATVVTLSESLENIFSNDLLTSTPKDQSTTAVKKTSEQDVLDTSTANDESTTAVNKTSEQDFLDTSTANDQQRKQEPTLTDEEDSLNSTL